MRMKLTFVNSAGKERELGIFETIEKANKAIQDFMDEHHYISYYTKVTHFHDKDVYDVGSWSELFIIYTNDNEPLNTRGVWEE